jgi:hypothetical protein
MHGTIFKIKQNFLISLFPAYFKYHIYYEVQS